MYKIIKAEKLNAVVYLMVVEAPMVAKHCQPGQFVIVKEDDAGERIPLTICDYDREAGTVTIVFQPIGASTEKFAKLQAGDSFEDFVGPLGCASELISEDIEELKKKKIVFIAGGVGTATGTLAGAIIMGLISNILNLVGVQSYVQKVVKGIIIILAVVMDVQSKKKKA